MIEGGFQPRDHPLINKLKVGTQAPHSVCTTRFSTFIQGELYPQNTEKLLELVVVQDVIMLTYLVRNVPQNKLQLDRQALGISAIEHGEIRILQLLGATTNLFDGCGDHLSFSCRSYGLDHLDRGLVRSMGNGVLFNPPLIVSDEAGSVIDDIARAAIVALQLKTFDLPPEMLLQLDNVARRTSAEAVDGLIVISSNNQSRFLGDEAYESKIKLVDILKFIDDDLVVSPLNK